MATLRRVEGWPQLEGDLEGCVVVPEDSCRMVMAGMDALLLFLEAHPERVSGDDWVRALRWAVGDMHFFLGMGKVFKAARDGKG